jgi:hypothetical protein
MCFSGPLSGYALTDHVRNALQVYALEEIQDKKKQVA